jgi:uncharacterized NAD(P)/FAD-binding protein YdhS
MGHKAETIAVVGGGASGVLAAVHLLRDAPVRVRVVLIEPRAELGGGVAFGTEDPNHLLNVRASSLSALPEEPDHFAAWAHRRFGAGCQSFLPRAWYGEYLRSLLEPVEHVPARAIDISPLAGRAEITLSDGTRRPFDRVILAPGSSPPAWPEPLGGPECSWVGDPWGPNALAALSPDDPVLLVGTGLTAVDAALSLHSAGHRHIIATSRHGLLPAAHPDHPFPPIEIAPPFRPTARELLEWVRSTVDETGDWRPVVDALRPHTDGLWGAMDPSECRRLLRHVHRRWEVLRHRMAPSVARRIESMRASGQLTVVPGGVRAADVTAGGIAAVVGDRRTRFGAIVNCTGPGTNIHRSNHPLVKHLLARGVVRPGPFGLGLDTDAAGCLPSTDGVMWLVGPLRRGGRWETTAIPDIRGQAAALPRSLWRVGAMVSA